MDVEKVTEWIAPIENGAPLLTMPNIPKPLHHLAPRTIEGQAKWNLMRTRCYMDADYTCQACGKYLGAGHCEAHELYSVNWEKQRVKFERCVCLCSMCHRLIHSGRAITMYQKGERGFSADLMLKNAQYCFRVLQDYEEKTGDRLKVYGTMVEWLKDPELKKWLEPMVEKYGIEFYGPLKSYEDEKHWSKWRLEYKGKLYEPKYKNAKEWMEAMK